MKTQELDNIAARWEGTGKGYAKLSFEDAHKDMRALLAEVRSLDRIHYRIKELEAHVAKRNADMQAFAVEVGRLANQKYSDYAIAASPTPPQAQENK